MWQLKKHYEDTQKHLSYGELDKLMQQLPNLEQQVNYRLLWKAGISQQLLRNLSTNYVSFFKALKDYDKHPAKYLGRPRPPKFRQDNYYYLPFDNQRFVKKGDKIQLKKDFFIPCPKQLLDKKICQVEIYYRYGYFEAIFSYETTETNIRLSKNDNILAIDLGLNNLATCVSNGIIKPFVINGRPLKSINQYYNKRASKLKSVLKKRNDKDHSKKLEVLTRKRQRQLTDYLHKASHQLVTQCVANQLTTVIIGNVQNSNTKINLGKRTNQNFVNLSLGQFIQKITYKLEKHHITVITREESYTSKASFLDTDTMPSKKQPEKQLFSGTRIKRGLYKSAKGVLINADVNGAYNILRKETPKFSADTITNKEGVAGWLHPYKLAV